MSKEPEYFDYVAALKNQPRPTAPRAAFGPSPRQRATFGPSPRHRQRVVTSAQAPNKQLASIYGKRDSVTESMKCPTFGASKSSSASSKSNKSRWSNFAKTPSPPRETPNFIKARTTLQQSAKTSEIDLAIGSREASIPVTAMKQPVQNNRLFQTPSQTINSTAFMSEERMIPESYDTSTKIPESYYTSTKIPESYYTSTKIPESYDTSTKIQKLKQTGLYDRIRSLTCKLQIDEDEEDQSTEIGSRTSETGAVGGHDEDRNEDDGRNEDSGRKSDEGSSGEEMENDSNIPNKFLINDSIMIIKETFSAKKKMMQLGMLPVPRSNQMHQSSPGNIS